ncbi:hypothetical protein [Desulfothermobacter acidiphilus]|uniref:hypothetical protein n=1 Tax=Desulfothermobacter acidiphilus TaxID=1938353 RepID=UPI003F8C37D2
MNRKWLIGLSSGLLVFSVTLGWAQMVFTPPSSNLVIMHQVSTPDEDTPNSGAQEILQMQALARHLRSEVSKNRPKMRVSQN